MQRLSPPCVTTQVAGFKYVRLYSQLQTPFLYTGKGQGGGEGAKAHVSPVKVRAVFSGHGRMSFGWLFTSRQSRRYCQPLVAERSSSLVGR